MMVQITRPSKPRRLGYTSEQMCGHGFRAMARTILDEVLGYPIEVIEMQLAHAVKDANVEPTTVPSTENNAMT